ncbi:MAG: hypothetical protein KDJ44_20055 [Rhodoblastus sp.]|nr:hypothetical protein [Rhodoblastus sp.]
MAAVSLRRVLLAALVVVGAAFGLLKAEAGERTPVPQPVKPAAAEKCVADTQFMRRNHMKMLLHQRDETVHEGIRTKQFSLANCVSCHAVKGADGKPVAYSDPKHFCRTCHSYAAVRVDCFECHASRPEEKAKAANASDSSHDPALSALSAHVAEMKK